MKSFKNVKNLVASNKIHITPRAEMDEKILGRIVESLERTEKTTSAGNQPKIWRVIMKSKITKFAAAAVLIIGVIIGVYWYSGSIDGASIAFADVQEQLRNFRPYSYNDTVEWDGNPETTLKKHIMKFSKSRRREVILNLDGRIMIVDFSQAPCKTITIFPETKKAREKVHPDIKPGTGADILQTISRYQELTQELSIEDLGTQEMEGRLAKGFHIPGEVNEWTIWVDAQSGLPMYVERVHLPVGKLPRRQKLIMTNFDFDVEFDESDFIVKAPPGYDVTVIEK